MPDRSIRAVFHAPREPKAKGFEVAMLHPELVGGGFDPFLQIDAFALAEPVFKPHPHAGFSAVTYILPESPIGFVNRDSLGDRRRISPGALHWTMAGSGLHHEEVPERLDVAAIGLQMFIDLPVSLKQAAPRVLHLDPNEIPVVAIEGGLVRPVIGASNGEQSPLDSPTPGVNLIDVTLEPGAVFRQEIAPGENSNIYMLDGKVAAGRTGTSLGAFDLAASAHDGTFLTATAGIGGARFVLFGGKPLNQPIFARGPFVLESETSLREAMNAYAAGRMGRLMPNTYDANGRPIL